MEHTRITGVVISALFLGVRQRRMAVPYQYSRVKH